MRTSSSFSSWSLRAGVLALTIAAMALAPIPWASANADVHGTIDTASGPLAGVRCGSVARDGTSIQVTLTSVTPGAAFELTADAGSWKNDFDIAFYPSLTDCQAGTGRLPHSNHAGDETAAVPATAAVAMVTLRGGDRGSAFTYREVAHAAPTYAAVTRRPTVVAVIEPYDAVNADANGFNPYHWDFGGAQHPWNADADPSTGFDATEDPANYLPGYPSSTAVNLTLSTNGTTTPDSLRAQDASTWASMEGAATAATAKVYRFPGTKVIGAVSFGTATGPGTGDLYAPDSHATHSASVAVGNIHGTCQECAVVFVSFRAGGGLEALKWVAQQRWIDVVTNSYGYTGMVLPWTGEDAVTKPATIQGQTVFWAAGNGEDMAALTYNPTYTTARSGPDWHVTVGAIDPDNDQTMGVGQPVDITSYGDAYTAGGGATVSSGTTHSGTSNATPVVAGTFASIVQAARDLVGDSSPGHQEDGVVARGTAVSCGAANAACPLGDGVLTRTEAQALLFTNVVPSPFRTGEYPVVSTTPAPASASGAGDVATGPSIPKDYGLVGTYPPVFPYQTQGHGIVYGHRNAAELPRFTAEQRRFREALVGVVAPFSRPPGEHNWMVVDSKCRQRLWLEWDGGYYKSGDPDPAFDPTVDQPAIVANAACSALPRGLLSSAPSSGV